MLIRARSVNYCTEKLIRMLENSKSSWRLVSVAVGPKGRQEFELNEGENVVGRKRDYSVFLCSLDVSRRQCVIYSTGQDLTLVDVGSTNGTYINGQRIDSNILIPLFENDTVGFGLDTNTIEKYTEGYSFLVYRITKRLSFKVIEKFALHKRELPTKRKPDTDPLSPEVKKIKCSPQEASRYLPHPLASTSNAGVTMSFEKGSFISFYANPAETNLTLCNSRSDLKPSSQHEMKTRSQNSKENETKDPAGIPSSSDHSAQFVDSLSRLITVKNEPPPLNTPFQINQEILNVTDVPTFSLLSDDEDDDFQSSQLFLKKGNAPYGARQSNGVSSLPDGPSPSEDFAIISDDDDDCFMVDSDNDSFFEKHLSQAIIIEDVPENHPVPAVECKGNEFVEDCKITTIKGPNSGVRKKDRSKIRKSESSSDHSVRPVNKKLVTQKKSSVSTLITTGVSSSKLDCDEPQRSYLRRTVSPFTADKTVKTAMSVKLDLGQVVKKVKTDMKQKKKALLLDPMTLNGNHASQRILRTAAVASSKLPIFKTPANSDQLNSRKKSVTFCEDNLKQYREFESDASMKKLPTKKPTLYPKEARIISPVFSLNSYLLRTSEITRIICSWNLMWFQEMTKLKSEPPLVDFKPNPIGNKFLNFSDYYQTMRSLMMHELWSELNRLNDQQTISQSFQVFEGHLQHVESNSDGLTLLALCKFVTKAEDSTFMPTFGDVVGVQILAQGETSRKLLYDSFGVVTKQFSTPRINCEEGKKIVSDIELVFRESRRHAVRADNAFVRLRGFRNVLSWHKNLMALKKAMLSPLKSVIVDPSTITKVTPSRREQIGFNAHIMQLPLNMMQADAVYGITHSVLKSNSSISLIHGPPGTGKSTTISALVLKLLEKFKCSHGNEGQKILLCAPSNTAIDELVLKLLEIRKRMTKNKFKLTRVGNEKMMHPSVAEVSSISLARRTVSTRAEYAKEDFEMEIKLAEARLVALRNFGKNGDSQKCQAEISKIETRIAQNRMCLANLNAGKAPVNHEATQKLLNESELNIISGAEIIATTLSSSVSRKIIDALGSSQIGCCVVDEATQATEPEVLLPVLLNVNHLILVGDPQQLGPTILSKHAKTCNFDHSFYHRLMSEWNSIPNSPLYSLHEQYRMHEDIVHFPSKKFYHSQLKTPDFLRVNYQFSSYQVVSHSWPENSNEETNVKEARCVVDLVQKICSSELFPKMSVGVIVPYQAQRSLTKKIISSRNDKSLESIVVNTIDSFQGQEKDVIILSCVRTSRIGFLSDRQRLNVALTRARKCLIVIGNFHSLKNDEFWKAMIDDASLRGCFIKANQNDRIAAKLIFSQVIANRPPSASDLQKSLTGNQPSQGTRKNNK